MPRVLVAALASLLLVAAAAVPSHAAEGVPAFEHVIVVILENHAFGTVSELPYTASLIASSTTFANSYALTHPSQPNYLALWGGSTFGVTVSDCPPPRAPYSTPNLGSECEALGLGWKGYCEALPAPGDPTCGTDDGLYVRRHCPWYAWDNCTLANSVPFEQLALDTAAHALPALAFVIPNQCDNTHDCEPQQGDDWLAAQLPGLIDAVGPRGLVVLTWDEDDYSDANHILTVFAGPLVRAGYVSERPITHYAVLRTLCAGLGLAPMGAAIDDSAITDAWSAAALAVPPAAPSRATWLDSPAPDPARAAVSATLHLAAPARIDAAVFDAAGRRVRTLTAGTLASASLKLRWDGRDEHGRDATAGVYFLRVRAGEQTLVRRFVRVR